MPRWCTVVSLDCDLLCFRSVAFSIWAWILYVTRFSSSIELVIVCLADEFLHPDCDCFSPMLRSLFQWDYFVYLISNIVSHIYLHVSPLWLFGLIVIRYSACAGILFFTDVSLYFILSKLRLYATFPYHFSIRFRNCFRQCSIFCFVFVFHYIAMATTERPLSSSQCPRYRTCDLGNFLVIDYFRMNLQRKVKRISVISTVELNLAIGKDLLTCYVMITTLY